jgi:hypothetical protein
MGHECSRPGSAKRRCRVGFFEGLEERALLAVATPGFVAFAQQVYSQYVGELQEIELRSKATPAQFQALRDDAHAISEVAVPTNVPATVAANKARTVSVQIDRAPLFGWMGQTAWSDVVSRLTANLDTLGVPQSLIDQTAADMKSVAASAHVTASEYNTFISEFNTLRSDESQLGGTYANIPDPGTYYDQHLIGFFRGSAVDRATDKAKLSADLGSIASASGATPAGVAALRRDARLLQTLGAVLQSTVDDQFHDAYVAAFNAGPPTAQTLAGLKTDLVALLGAEARPARVADVSRLVADAPAFYEAAGSSLANVGTIADDARAVVNDGGGSPLNPFRVSILNGPGGGGQTG